jgi:uncharacterized protein YbjT (DUF2867 family)
MDSSRVVIVGATGMIGGLALKLALADPEVSAVTAIGRRGTGLEDPKLREIGRRDFTNFRSLEAELLGHDVALFCLGAYTGKVPDAEFKEITVDYTVAFAETFYTACPLASFCFLSGQGADQTEKSRIAFAKYKGMAENALLEVGFPRVHIFRPGYIYPVTARPEPNLTYRIMRPLYPVVRRLYPNIGISSDDLARAMLEAGISGTPGHASPILENRDIRRFAAGPS